LRGGEPLQHAEAVEARHPEVDERHVERLALGEPHAFFATRGDGDAIALAAERFPEQLAGHLVVVDDEQRGWLAHPARSTPGRRTWKVLPRPSSLSISMRPLCSRTISALRKSPRPVPRAGSFVEKNGSKRCARAAAGIPRPVSVTAISIAPCAGTRRAATSMRPPGGVASIALVRRLRMTCCSWSARPSTGGTPGSTRTSSVRPAAASVGRTRSAV